MQYAVALLALVASASAQTATGTPPSCSTDFPQLFTITNKNVSSSAPSKRDLIAERGVVCTSTPIIKLKGGVMTDQINSQAEIVANHQFQFDVVLQSGRLFDAGFSVCQNNTLAIGPSAVFWACNSGDITNIYDQSLGKQCYQIYLEVSACDSVSLSPSIPVSSAALSATSAVASPSSAPSTLATTSAASVVPTTAATTAATTVATTAATTSSLPGPALPSVAPFPKGNSTMAAGAPSATAPGRATTSVLTAPASGASVITAGSTFGLVAAALIAFAMF